MSNFTLADFDAAADAAYGPLTLTDIGVTIPNILMLSGETLKTTRDKIKELDDLDDDTDTELLRQSIIDILCTAADRPDVLRASIQTKPLGFLMSVFKGWNGKSAGE